MVNSKKKGNHFENVWANWLRDNGIKAWKDGASGGGNREKSDVGNSIDFSFQVKAVKKLNLQEAWRQAKRDAELVQDKPCVVVHFDGMGQDQFLVVMDNYDWLEMIKGKKIETGASPADWEKKRAFENAESALKRAIKYF